MAVDLKSTGIQLPDVATADVAPAYATGQPQPSLAIEPDYAATEDADIPEDQALARTLSGDLGQLTDEELVALAQARFSGQDVPQALAMKVPNLMQQFAKEAYDATPKNALVSAAGTVATAAKDLAVGGAVGAASGVLNTATAVVDGLNWLDDAAGWDFINNEGIERVRERTDAAQDLMESWIPKSFVGGLSGSVGRFGVGMVAASGAAGLVEKTAQGRNLLMGLRMLVSPKTATFVGGLAKGAVASTVAFSPDDSRFADLVQQFPALRNPITEYLAAEGNESDTLAEKRLKQAIDSVLGDVVTEGLLKAVVKSLKLFKRGGASASSTAEAVKALDDAGTALEKAAQTADNGINKAGVIADDRQVAEVGHRPRDGKRPRRGNGKIKYEDARAGVGQGSVEADAVPPPVRDGGLGNTAGDGGVHQSGIPAAALSAPDASPLATPDTLVDAGAPHATSIQFDEDAALATAQRLYAKGVADGGTPYEFHPTNDVTNAKYYNEVILQDGGVARLLELGNDINKNVLNRPVTEFSVKPLEETAKEARNILRAYSGNEKFLSDLSEAADFAETLGHKVIMARDATAQSAYVLGGVLKKLDDPALDATARQALIDGEAKTALRNYATLASFFDRISTGTARALNAHKIKGELSQPIQRIMDTVNAMDPDSVVGLMRRIAVTDNPLKGAKMLRVVNQTTGQKFAGMVTEYWINSILSGIVTNTVNFSSNLLKAGVIMPLDNLVMGWGGFDGGLFHINNREAWNQGVYAWWGMAEAFRESWDMAVKSFKLGSNILKADNSIIEQQARKISSAYAGVASESAMGRFLDGFGKVVNIPTRFLMAADEFASQMAYRSNVRVHLMGKAQELFAKGAGEGLTRKEFVAQYIKDNFDSFFTDAVSGSGAVVRNGTGTFKQALDASMEATFTKPLIKGTIPADLQNLAARHPLIQHIMPFVRTPMNILDDTIQRMPLLRNLSAEFRAARQEGGEAWARAQAKMTVGLAFMGTAASLYLTGNITGNGPKDKATRDALMATGWRPNSIKVGGAYVSYARFEPFASMFGTITDAMDLYTAAMSSPDTADGGTLDNALQAVWAAGFGVMKNLASKTYLSGAGELLNAAGSDDASKMERFATRYLTSYVPSVLNSARRLYDPTTNEVRGIIDTVKDKIPGLSSSLPPKYSWITGQPIQYMGGRASGFSPVVWESDKNDETLTELARLAGGLNAPSGRMSGVKLSPQQLSDYQRLHGTVTIGGKTMLESLRNAVQNKDRLSRMIDGGELADGTDTVDPMLIRFNSIIRQYRKKAESELKKLYPELKGTNNTPQKDYEKRYRDSDPGAAMASVRERALESIAKF